MPIEIVRSAKEPMPNGISSDKTDHTGIKFAAILINREADLNGEAGRLR